MPRISTATLAQHRDWRRQQLISAASAIALEDGGRAVTVAAVAERAGLSRTSVYEYFGSSAELVADLVIEELTNFSEALRESTDASPDPYQAIRNWIDAALRYIADGRHLLAKAFSATSLPIDRTHEIVAAHRALLAPLETALSDIGVADVVHALVLIQSVTDAATRRIETGSDSDLEIETATNFCIAGIDTLVRG
ncbi:MAG TPA: TetR/AcrR family transcriptional regulator [Candidatus Paceibacterota bacterium]|nr:TetR/AcrR family transcriptional regulator [Candidatus Paceibacterota bacterium]